MSAALSSPTSAAVGRCCSMHACVVGDLSALHSLTGMQKLMKFPCPSKYLILASNYLLASRAQGCWHPAAVHRVNPHCGKHDPGERPQVACMSGAGKLRNLAWLGRNYLGGKKGILPVLCVGCMNKRQLPHVCGQDKCSLPGVKSSFS